METLSVNQNQENPQQRVFLGKENPTNQTKKSYLPKNQRTVFGSLQQSILHKNNVNNVNKASYFAPSQIIAVNCQEPAFQIYQDDASLDESKSESETCNETVREVKKIIVEEISMEEEEDVVEDEKNLFSCSLSPIKLELSELEETSVSRTVDFYLADNHDSLKKAELKFRPRPNYVKKQPFINERMRAVTLDWLVAVSNSYRMQNETLYLAVNYFDRFLSRMSVVKKKLQLVGVTALMIAAKYEEIKIPSLEEYIELTDNSYSKECAVRMEELILRCLTFDLSVPTPITFLDVYCHYGEISDEVKFLAMYICELTLMQSLPYLEFLPSCLAASSIALAQHIMREEVWGRDLKIFSGYELNDLKDCINALSDKHKDAEKMEQKEVRKKYRHERFMNVARILPRVADVPFDRENMRLRFDAKVL